VKKSRIRQALSHPVALDQCRDFFRKNPKIQPIPFYDTAGSVKHVIESGMRNAAGIASRHAASVYKGRILAAGIEDDKRNFTRFFLLRRKTRILPGANKTSIAFAVKNVPGSLHKALRVFAERDISLSKIESRPMRGRPWEYVFYTDFLRGDDKLARGALLQLGTVADMVKVMGVYPAA
jgi:prephenate dehydratase